MERYSIFETGAAAPAPDPAPSAAKGPEPSMATHGEPATPVASAARKILFPGDDGGKSLNEMAQRDLEMLASAFRQTCRIGSERRGQLRTAGTGQ